MISTRVALPLAEFVGQVVKPAWFAWPLCPYYNKHRPAINHLFNLRSFMRALVQRVSRASVQVAGETVSAIGLGCLILLGITHTDREVEAVLLARKIAGLRILEDAEGKLNLALAEVGGAALVVSQFTLYADVRKGRRPSFTDAARPEQAQPLYLRFCQRLAAEGLRVEQGIFQAHMEVALVNDGPVTIWLDTAELGHTS
jgi:D-tyrosyl-tRNA(Tyr) deacylase